MKSLNIQSVTLTFAAEGAGGKTIKKGEKKSAFTTSLDEQNTTKEIGKFSELDVPYPLPNVIQISFGLHFSIPLVRYLKCAKFLNWLRAHQKKPHPHQNKRKEGEKRKRKMWGARVYQEKLTQMNETLRWRWRGNTESIGQLIGKKKKTGKRRKKRKEKKNEPKRKKERKRNEKK